MWCGAIWFCDIFNINKFWKKKKKKWNQKATTKYKLCICNSWKCTWDSMANATDEMKWIKWKKKISKSRLNFLIHIL